MSVTNTFGFSTPGLSPAGTSVVAAITNPQETAPQRPVLARRNRYVRPHLIRTRRVSVSSGNIAQSNNDQLQRSPAARLQQSHGAGHVAIGRKTAGVATGAAVVLASAKAQAADMLGKASESEVVNMVLDYGAPAVGIATLLSLKHRIFGDKWGTYSEDALALLGTAGLHYSAQVGGEAEIMLAPTLGWSFIASQVLLAGLKVLQNLVGKNSPLKSINGEPSKAGQIVDKVTAGAGKLFGKGDSAKKSKPRATDGYTDQ